MALEKSQSGVPALYTPSFEIDSDDIILPRIKVADKSHDVVTDGLVKVGSLYSTTGGDDPEPVVLSDAGQDADGIVVHVLDLKKGKSKVVNDELQRWEFGDPDAPADADTTYDFTLAVPEADDDVPYKLLLKRTSAGTAKQMISVIAKARGIRPAHEIAFRIKTKERRSDKYRWHVATVRQEEAKAENVEIAARLAELVAQRPDLDTAATTDEQPRI